MECGGLKQILFVQLIELGMILETKSNNFDEQLVESRSEKYDYSICVDRS